MDTPSSKVLDKKQRGIVAIAALTAKGDAAALKAAIYAGLNNGLAVNDIKEVLIQMYAYCGFPRSLNGINALMSAIEERKAKGIQDTEGRDASPITDNDKYQTGKATLQKLTGKEEKALAGANAFAPAIDTFLKEHLFADIFSRDVLSYYQRELATISALMSMNGVEPQLQAHITMGMNVGITEYQLRDMIDIIEKNVGNKEAELSNVVLAKALAAN